MSHKLGWQHWFALALIVVISIAARVWQIDRRGAWDDELFSMELSTGRRLTHQEVPTDRIVREAPNLTGLAGAPSWWHVFSAMRDDTHPPLHALVLRFWREIFGESDVAGRSLSIVFSVVGVIVLFDTVRQVNEIWTAVCAAGLMAVAGPQIYYAQETRDYAMVVALVLACCDIVTRIETRGASGRRCAIFGLLLLLTMLTHYGAAAALVAIVLYALIRIDHRSRTRVLVACCVAAVIYLIAWGPMLWQQRTNFTNNMLWSLESRNDNLRQTPARLADLPMLYLFEPMTTTLWLTRILAALYIVPLLLLRRRPQLLLWWLILILAVGSIAVSDLMRSSYLLHLIRYTLIASAAVYAIIAITLSLLPSLWSRISQAAVVLACGVALVNAYPKDNADFRGFARYVNSHVAANDLMIFTTAEAQTWKSGVLYLAITHYHKVDSGHDTAPCAVLMLRSDPSPQLMNQIRNWPGGCWMLDPWSPEPSLKLEGARDVAAEPYPFVGTIRRLQFQ
jgi:uncharacterized membrane protein